jgi:hypothetical protein
MKLRLSNWKWLTAYGLFFYLVFLIINVPADFVWSLTPPQLKRGIILSNLQGSAWSASADNVIINNFELGKANWTLNPLLLFIGKLGGQISIRNAMGQARSDFALQTNQLVELSDLTGEFNAGMLDPALRPFTLTGVIKSNLSSLQIQRKVQLVASGNMQWNNATVTGVQEVALGNVQFNASPEAKGTLLKVSNDGGLIGITGDIRVAGNGHYTLNLLLSNRDKRRSDVNTMLSILGRADAQGRVRFNQQGVLRIW